MPVPMRIVERPAFTIAGRKTWISGPDNEQFGRFWDASRAAGLFDRFDAIQRAATARAGAQTGGAVLGVSRVEQDPANRAFYYMIAIELPEGADPGDLETCAVPACTWAVFECRGPLPDAIVAAEMYAFMEWLPASGCQHALAPEMEVYPDADFCEFWLPVVPPL